MSAFMKIQGIEGEAVDKDHKNWITLNSMSSPIFRSIPNGARGVERNRGSTTVGDIVVVRNVDKSSVKIAESCANGTFYSEVDIDFCTEVNKKQQPFLQYKLKNVILTGYSFHGTGSGTPIPSEEVTLGYTSIDWTFVVVDHETGKVKGQVAASYAHDK